MTSVRLSTMSNKVKDCPICCNKETSCMRKMIKCNYCNIEVCKKCISRYLLETKQTPHCMECKHEWNPDFICSFVTQKFFHQDLREHLAKNYLEKEKLKLPETQIYVERELKIRRIKSEIREINSKIRSLEYKINDIKNDKQVVLNRRYFINVRIKILKSEYGICPKDSCIRQLKLDKKTGKVFCVKCNLEGIIDENEKKVMLSEYKKKSLENSNSNKSYNTILKELKEQKVQYITEVDIKRTEIYELKGNKNVERRKFIKACPDEKCKGFLSTAWKCGICEKTYCKDCHIEKTEDHVCDEDTKKTIALLAKDTKPCPKCGTGIFKIDGCDQMWCVDCNTAFSWRTGQIETGVIHNPHYYQWMRDNNNGEVPRNPLDNLGDPCAANVSPYMITNTFGETNSIHGYKYIKANSEYYLLVNYARLRDHVSFLLERYYVINENEDLNLRVLYMLNELTEEKWYSTLRVNLKNREYITEIRQILLMYSGTINELLLDVINTKDTTKIYDELSRLTNYTKDNLQKISKIYKRQLIRLNYYNTTMIDI